MSLRDVVLRWLVGERRSVTLTPAMMRSLLLNDVNQHTALSISAVWACVRVLSESVASLPLILYRRRADGGKERATGHPLYGILHDAWNDEISSFQARETMMAHLLTWGNAYAQIVRSTRGRVMALSVLRPDRMQVRRRRDGALEYVYPGVEPPFRADEVLHIAGLGFDGLRGYSPIAMQRRAISYAMTAEEFGEAWLQNGSTPGLVLKYPGVLSEQAYANLQASIEARHQGPGNANRLMILEEGMDVDKLSIPPSDAQFLESRKFQVAEIARIYRVPPHMIADLERATFSNIEHQSIEFVVHALRPWLVRWEQAISMQLLTPQERRAGYFAEFLVDGLLRGDIQSRYQAYAVGRQNGWLSANDIRRMENMNPIPGGDVYLVPLNMIPAGDVAGTRQLTMQERALQPPQETRAKGGERRRLMLAWYGRFAEAARRVLRAHGKAVLAALDDDNLENTLRDILRNGQQDWADAFDGPLREYADLVAQAAAQEAGKPLDDAARDALERLLEAYLGAFSRRQTAWSIRDVLDALADEEGGAEARLSAMVEHWDERADSIGQYESTRANGAVSSAVWGTIGVQALHWVTFGDDCPYCAALDGTSIPVGGVFIHGGAAYQPDDVTSPLVTRNTIKHPPAHRGCDCMIGLG